MEPDPVNTPQGTRELKADQDKSSNISFSQVSCLKHLGHNRGLVRSITVVFGCRQWTGKISIEIHKCLLCSCRPTFVANTPRQQLLPMDALRNSVKFKPDSEAPLRRPLVRQTRTSSTTELDDKSISLFRQRMLRESVESTQIRNHVPPHRQQWFKYAAVADPEAAFIFQGMTEEVYELEGVVDDGPPKYPPEYLVRVQNGVILHWQAVLADWTRVGNPTETTIISCKAMQITLDEALKSLKAKLKTLSQRLEDPPKRDLGDPCSIADPFPAFRAATRIEDRLSRLRTHLQDTRTHMERRVRSSEQPTQPTAQIQLRRRKPLDPRLERQTLILMMRQCLIGQSRVIVVQLKGLVTQRQTGLGICMLDLWKA